MMKLNNFRIPIVFSLLLIFILIGTNIIFAADATEIEWKFLSSWGSEYSDVKIALIPFIEKVNQRAEGRLKISWVGPEAVSAFEQLKAVSAGLFDGLFSSPAYHMGEVGIGNVNDCFRATAEERREIGIVEVMDKAYQERGYNVKVLALTVDGVGYNIIFRKPIEKLDFSGLKIRSSNFYDPFIQAFGGSTVLVAPGEIYTALERGVVDAAAWPAAGMKDYGWYEVAKYMLRPDVGEICHPIYVNIDSWNKLPEDLQQIVTEAAREIEVECRENMVKEWKKEDEELLSRGAEIIMLSPEDAEKYRNTFYEETMTGLVFKVEPELGPQVKAMIDDYLASKK